MDAAYTKLVGRGAALRLHLVVPVAGLRLARRRRQGVPRRRLRRRPARGVPGGLPEPHRLDHPDPHAALRGDHPVHAVLVRAAVLAASRRSPGSASPRCARRSSSGATRSSATSSARKCSRSISARTPVSDAKDAKDVEGAAGSGQGAEGRCRCVAKAAAPHAGARDQGVEDGRDGQRRRRGAEGRLVAADAAAADQAAGAGRPPRSRRCRCRSPTRRRPSARRARTRCRPTPCSTRPRPSRRSTSAS